MSAALPRMPDGYTSLASEMRRYNVAIHSGALKKINKSRGEQKAGLEALIAQYMAEGPASLPRTKFNGDEGWFPSARAQNKIRLEAFKAWQLRAYGFCRSYNGSTWFFIVAVDPSKKKDKADSSILNAAGREAVRLNDEIERIG